MTSEKFTEVIHCPYCDTSNFIDIQKNCLYFPYPRIFNDKNTYASKISDHIFNKLEKFQIIQKRIEDKDICCLNCKKSFSLIIFLKKEDDPIYSDNLKERIQFLLGRERINQKMLLLERFLNWWYNLKILPFKSRLFDSYFLLALPLFLFLVIQYNQTRTFGILGDIPFMLLFILIGLLIYSFNLFNMQFHEALDISELPLDLSDNYKKSRFGQLFEIWKIKDPIYNFWSIPFFKNVHHATVYGFICATGYLFFYWLLVLISHKNLFIGQSEFNFVLAIGYLPYWLIVCFILGNILCLLLGTASVISEIFENLPVKIEILKCNGGFDSIINLCNLIIFQILIIGIIAVVWLYGLISIKFIEIDFSAFLREPIGLVLIVLIIIFMLSMYIMPMLLIVKKYQQAKKDYINKLGIKINSYYPSTYECNVGELQNLQFKYNLAISLPDWPTKFKISLIISLIVPIISWILTILK
nr:hypothetical protein [uncultured Methanoregula sp.]